ncbi:class I SAM-dependent methyltransferase family protein [Candidatus Woesearchaeota archaeon]|nr:class I SAM-dependent methyltransferase family protein [Candidatus Woesearchaeota archaeon]
MLALKVPLGKAEKWKDYLVKNSLYNKDYKIKKEKGFIFLPIKKRFHIIRAKEDIWFTEKKLEKQNKIISNLKEALKGKLSENELKEAPNSYDIIGDIAVMEIPEGLEKKEKIIGKTLLEINPKIKTVLKKADIHSGEFRTQNMKYIAGKKTKETIYRENNVRIKLDVEKVYFSVRLSHERERIANMIKKGETVLVMFSGCAPYPLVISKNTEAKEIYGVELNPAAHKYGIENIRLNKSKNIKLFLGDVKEVVPKLNMKFDRILMPLPKTGKDFLDTALNASKKGTVIHFYDFGTEKEFKEIHKKIKKICKKENKKCKILHTEKCGDYAPYVYRVCVDFKVM